MTQAFRVGGGASLDRTRPLSFTFDGVAYGGYMGDTLASALLANGVRLIGRSYKYHRPRGHRLGRCGGAECARRRVAWPRPLHPEPARDPGRTLRRPHRDEPEPLALAPLRRRGNQRRRRAGLRRGVLLQDIHGPGHIRQQLGLEHDL